MKLKNNLQFFIFWTVLVVSATSKKKSSKLRLVAENKYDDILLLTYNSSRSEDASTRFFEAAKAFGFNQQKVLNCAPNGNDCGQKLLNSIEEYVGKNNLIILLNTDYSMVNCQKTAFIYSMINKEEKIIISEHGLDQDNIGIQLVADVQSLKQFLQDHLSAKKTLLEVIRSIDQVTMDSYSMIFSNSKKDESYRYFFNIDGQIMQESISVRYSPMAGKARVNTRLVHQIGILVQTDLSNEYSTQAMDQIYNFLVHPTFEINQEFRQVSRQAYTSVLIAVIVDQGAIFLEEFFDKLQALNYPQEKTDVYITCQSQEKLEFVQNVVKSWIENDIYQSVTLEKDFKDVITSRQKIVTHAKHVTKSKFIFFIRTTSQLEDEDVLRRLVECEKSVVTPLLTTYRTLHHTNLIRENDSGINEVFSFYQTSLMAGNVTGIDEKFQSGVNFLTIDKQPTFWHPLEQDHSEKLEGMVKDISTFDSAYFLKGLVSSLISDSLWRVKSMKDCYLVRTDDISIDDFSPSDAINENHVFDNDFVDFQFARKLIQRGIALHLLNKRSYGQIVNMMNLPEEKAHPELMRIFENHDLWEKRYITKTIRETLTDHPDDIPRLWPSETIQKGKCPDTYEVALFTELFCDHVVEEAEKSQKWFRNSFESFPAYDIALFQLDLEEMWMATINFYLLPRKMTVFPSQSKPDKGGNFFINRYRPGEQTDLAPHDDDNSIYTTNLALNRAGIDYEGGGTKFHRYNCSVTDLPKGHLLVHPGRMTHNHEGLTTTKGTRYILISFVTPNSHKHCYQRHGLSECDEKQRTSGQRENNFYNSDN